MNVFFDLKMQIPLDHRGHVHTDAEKHDIPKRCISHLPADQVPGKGKQHHYPQEGQLGLVGGEHPGRGQGNDEDGAVKSEISLGGIQ